MLAAVELGNCGVGSSLKLDGIMNRTVDFNVVGSLAWSHLREWSHFKFSPSRDVVSRTRHFRVLATLACNTTFKSMTFHEHWNIPWIVSDSSAALHCRPKLASFTFDML